MRHFGFLLTAVIVAMIIGGCKDKTDPRNATDEAIEAKRQEIRDGEKSAPERKKRTTRFNDDMD